MIRTREFNRWAFFGTVAALFAAAALLFPATLEINDNSLGASGVIEIRHSDIGLVPFKAFLSTIRVRDEIVLQYLIQADRDVVQPD